MAKNFKFVLGEELSVELAQACFHNYKVHMIDFFLLDIIFNNGKYITGIYIYMYIFYLKTKN